MALKTSLVSYYKLNEASGDALDAHGSNDLTDNNTVGATTGKIGNCRSFAAASSEYFRKNSLVIPDNSDFSVSFWLRLASTGFHSLVQESSGDGLFVGVFSSTSIYVRMYTGSGYVDATKAFGGSVGTWYFIAITYVDSTGVFTVDVNNSGSPGSNTNSGGLYTGSGSNFSLAQDMAGFGYLDGDLDECAIWSRTVSGSEFTEIYNSGNGLGYDDWDVAASGSGPILRGRTLGSGRIFGGSALSC